MKPSLKKKQQSTPNFEAGNRANKSATALSEEGIRFSKIDDMKFRKLLEPEVGYKVLSKNSLRKQNMGRIVAKKKQDFDQKIQNKKFYNIFDETKTTNQENVVALILGAIAEPDDPFLLDLRIMGPVNGEPVTKYISEKLHQMFPNAKQFFKLFVSHGAPYCPESGQLLKLLFPESLHILCLSHAMPLSFEVVQENCENADKSNLI